MTEQQISRALQRKAAAAYRARLRAQTSQETVTWHPIPGPQLPDDGITVLIQIGFDDEMEIWPAYLEAEEWFYGSGDVCCCTPSAWCHMPAGISRAKYTLMQSAQHRGRPGRPSKEAV